MGIERILNLAQDWDVSKWCHKDDAGTGSSKMSRIVAEGEVGERTFRQSKQHHVQNHKSMKENSLWPWRLVYRW